MSARRAEELVHGVEGPVAVITGRVARVLMNRAGLDAFRRDHRGQDVEVDNALMALTLVALSWANKTLATDPGSVEVADAEPVAPSAAMSTTEAARAVGVSDRAIRGAISSGRLPADLVGGRWVIAAENVAHYRAARAA